MSLCLCSCILSLSAPSALNALHAQQQLLGRISFPNSGSPAAQAPFIRGVLLLHSFEYDDAIAAFREAQQVDPGFALAYWGEAMCYNQPLWYNENVDKARQALGRLAADAAARQAKAPTAREKGYLDAVERMFGNVRGASAGSSIRGGGPGLSDAKASRNRAYAERMAELSRQFPNDDEAAAFYALALLGARAETDRDTSVMQKAGAIALAVLKRNPQHPGAAHYALHAFDDGEHAAMGLEAARTYARIAPASSHARHMPSHVFLPLGMWDDAAASDESSFAVSIDRVKRLGLSMAQADFHSLGWLQYEYLQQGRFAKAREAMTTVEDALAARDSVRRQTPMHQHVESEIGRGYGPMSLKGELASMRARLVLESGRWEEMKGRSSFDNVDELFALGIASVKLGDEARAEAVFDQLQQARVAAPDPDNKRLASIMSGELAGLIQLVRGQKTEAMQTLAGAARAERAPVSREAGRRGLRGGAAPLRQRRRSGAPVPGVAGADAAPRRIAHRPRPCSAGRGSARGCREGRARVHRDVARGRRRPRRAEGRTRHRALTHRHISCFRAFRGATALRSRRYLIHARSRRGPIAAFESTDRPRAARSDSGPVRSAATCASTRSR